MTMRLFQRPGPNAVRIAFVAGGGLFLLIGIWLLSDVALFLQHADTSDGMVTEMVDAGEGRESPRVEFIVDGKTIEFTSRVSSDPPSFTVGDPVRVVFRPEDPNQARVDSFEQLWLIPLGATLFGSIFIAMGIAIPFVVRS